ncbi:ring-cleaving dioxygenase [Caldibacillus lycopersici]|uniref:Ring-cleaving dioxygenase n=1 Tax=Perspicuibacillus lycopersici TaxID=1325689 RepID=A0AAE3IQY7_9BACI|nr:ring-cleaving dioxygenase [Perspicuibacillus lycopersici]MCU9612953.1 ring-cleaving dioxygenase [Perspicuibacillus lycopersici]
MMKKTTGIHHITAIVGHPQENVDFYAGVLGMRLVKQTVNFDDPGTYHFYFGDDVGNPGTIITFFPWANAYKGRIGDGQVGVTTYAVPVGSMEFWEKRLAKYAIPFRKALRFGEQFLKFDDPHGLHLELVERAYGPTNQWTFGEVTPEVAIKGFGGAILYSAYPEKTSQLLEELMGLEKVGEDGDYIRFQSNSEIGNIVDIKITPSGSRGRMGVGTVHHIAWRAEDLNDQLNWQKLLAKNGYGVTEIKDRNYFTSIYFKEHGEILFEIATDPPGFGIDEAYEKMGDELKLPPQYEPIRDRIEGVLLPFKVRELD